MMKKTLGMLVGLSLVVASSASAHDAPAAASTNPTFEKLKGLAGDWSMSMGEQTMNVSYKVTAGGSAVLETLFPGTPHEMLTLYYIDGKDLVLTHYCGAQNQPHLKAASSADPNKVNFNFVGGSNIDPKKTGHMHEMTMQFVDADHVHTEWTYFNAGKKGEVKSFDLARVKS